MMNASNITSEQIVTVRAFLAFLDGMDSSSIVEAIDRLAESENDGQFKATMASIEEDFGA